MRAMEPIRTLCENAGLGRFWSSSSTSRREKKSVGFNVDTEDYVDMFEAGVIDPMKVTRSAERGFGRGTCC